MLQAFEVQELRILELRCTTILFNSAITACGRCAQWEMALAIFTDHFTESLERCLVVIRNPVGIKHVGARFKYTGSEDSWCGCCR